MISKARVFSLAVLLAIAVVTPGVLKAQTAQPMSETSLGGGTTGTKTGGTATTDGTIIDGTVAPAPSPDALAGPEAATFDGTYIWVATQFTNSVTRVRVSDGAVAGTFTVGKRPVAVIYAAGYVWVANLFSDNVMKISPSTGAVAATYTVGD
jgi:hypothetical protein